MVVITLAWMGAGIIMATQEPLLWITHSKVKFAGHYEEIYNSNPEAEVVI